MEPSPQHTRPPPEPHPLPSIDNIRAAAARLRGIARRTPVLTCRSLDELAGARILLKCESFQRTGSFKFRGAYYALSRLGDQRGVLAYSSGNHAQAVALAAGLLNIPAVIVMPDDAPRVKLDATRAYLQNSPGRLILYSRAETTREQLAQELAEREGLTIIPPYDHPHIIAGQGTAALELLEKGQRDKGTEGQREGTRARGHGGTKGRGEWVEGGDEPLDYLFVPCGGGGLLSGCATAARALCPECTVIGVEPELADDAARSFATGRLHTVRDPPTIADGARTPSLGQHTFPIIQDRVDAFITVSESQILSATRLLWERAKLVVEPTGALGLAGLLRLSASRGGLGHARAGVIISGGNADLRAVASWLSTDPDGTPDD
jgi:threo-3-hydroxy-L-aspartate ammonia-lyase